MLARRIITSMTNGCGSHMTRLGEMSRLHAGSRRFFVLPILRPRAAPRIDTAITLAPCLPLPAQFDCFHRNLLILRALLLRWPWKGPLSSLAGSLAADSRKPLGGSLHSAVCGPKRPVEAQYGAFRPRTRRRRMTCI